MYSGGPYDALYQLAWIGYFCFLVSLPGLMAFFISLGVLIYSTDNGYQPPAEWFGV